MITREDAVVLEPSTKAFINGLLWAERSTGPVSELLLAVTRQSDFTGVGCHVGRGILSAHAAELAMKVVLQQESGAELEKSNHHHNLRKLYQNMPDRVRRYCEERWSNEHGDADLAQLLFDGDAITELRYLTGGRRPSSTVRTVIDIKLSTSSG